MKKANKLDYKSFEDIQYGNLEYCYRGNFSKAIVENILSLAETSIEKESNKATVKRRVYFIMVEGLQNITRHQEVKAELDENSGIFLIQQRDGQYFITTGNIIENDKVADLRKKLEKVNSLDKAELKKYYREILEGGKLSPKGGAGLGLIEMSRKSGNKLLFNFRKINEKISYFYFCTKVPNAKVIQNEDIEKEEKESKFHLEKIIDFHKVLNEENVIISFKGIFDQENMVNLLLMIEGQMKSSSISIKVFNIMMELIQNVVKHGEIPNNETIGRPGVFFISKMANSFIITSGNYILAENLEILKQQVDYVNTLDKEQLDDAYNKVLLEEDTESAKKTGLGLIYMRMKSIENLSYQFDKVDSKLYFYTLTAKI